MTDEPTEDSLRERLSGRQMIHRLREWEDGDTLYGARTYTDSGASGKTFREGSEFGDTTALDMAREQFAGELTLNTNGVSVLYSATVEQVQTDPRDPNDPGEPPLKFARLTDVEILDWKQPDGGWKESEDGGEGTGNDSR